MPTPPKPTLPPFWKWLMRVTFAVTMALFLAPTVYVVKYYAVDRPAEIAYAKHLGYCLCIPSPTMEAVVYWEQQARDARGERQIKAIKTLGGILGSSGANFRRPLECLGAKATLSDVAVQASDPAVRTAASEELGKVAQSGAVIRR